MNLKELKTDLALKQKKGLPFICASVAILFSSTLQLLQGTRLNSNVHILLRFSICLIGILLWAVFSSIKCKSSALRLLLQYVISMGLILLGMYILSFFVDWQVTHTGVLRLIMQFLMC